MLAFVCRLLFSVSVLASASDAAAQYADDDDWGPHAFHASEATPLPIVEPTPAHLGYATETDMPWHPRPRVLPAGVVTLTAGYLGGLALGATSVFIDRGSECDDALGGVQVIPVFGPIAAWAVAGLCRAQGLDPLIHGFLDVLPAVAQIAGFVTLLVGAAGRRGGRASARLEVSGSGLRVAF